MDLKLGIAIGTTLLLASAQLDSQHACTSYTDLSKPCGCAFTKDTFDPVCGSDGLTYLNTCFMECRNAVSDADIEDKYPGVCANEFKCECHSEYKPVCGSNNVTYSNECTLKCSTAKDSSIQLKYVGSCGSRHELSLIATKLKVKTCPDLRGICQKNKKNRRQLRTDSWEPEQEEFVRPSGENLEQPIDIEDHINNELSETYETQCRTVRGKCQKRKNRRQLRAYSWEMQSRSVEFIRPSDEYFQQPFSIEDHIINFDSKEHEDSSKEHEDSSIEHEEPKKKCICAEVHRPVCGNNQRTYSSFCVFFCDTKKHHALKFDHWGECANTEGGNREEDEDGTQRNKCICAAVHQPICANNKKTYPNLCVFHCDSKKDDRIQFHRWGPCTV